MELGNLYMNKDEHVAKISDEEINLSVREFDILYFLVFKSH